MKIVVLAGGISTERDVSLCSGRNIYEALKGNGHDVVLVDLFLGLPEEKEPLSKRNQSFTMTDSARLSSSQSSMS